ncbi:hypothetical protein [Caulobacter sp. DWR3-1-2]|uniref:hypothetical protein n=1 Tax=Caulobacter sp. DWR3-1-2 TaxID=2804647 RepID=UPI003CF86F46
MQFFEAINAVLKNNGHLSGWAQFLGAMIALGVTYFTANLPIWAAQRQERERAASLNAAAQRLLNSSALAVRRAAANLIAGGYAAENAMRTSSVLSGAVDALDRFPVHDLADQSSLSLAARLSEMARVVRDTMHAIEAHWIDARDSGFIVGGAAQEELGNLMHVNVTLTDATARGVEPVFMGPGADHAATASNSTTSSPGR